MAIPNVIGLYLLMPVVRREARQYRAKIESGEIRTYRSAHPKPSTALRRKRGGAALSTRRRGVPDQSAVARWRWSGHENAALPLSDTHQLRCI